MTKPEECPTCESWSLRNGICQHCGYEEQPSLPPFRARGVAHVRETRAMLRERRGANQNPEPKESE